MVIPLNGPLAVGDRFSLEIVIPEVEEHAVYTLRVHIDCSGSGDVSAGDRLTTQSYPVLTNGAPDHIDVEVFQI